MIVIDWLVFTRKATEITFTRVPNTTNRFKNKIGLSWKYFFVNIYSFNYTPEVVRVAGVEPASQPWEGHILPLYYTRIFALEPPRGFEPRTPTLRKWCSSQLS